MFRYAGLSTVGALILFALAFPEYAQSPQGAVFAAGACFITIATSAFACRVNA